MNINEILSKTLTNMEKQYGQKSSASSAVSSNFESIFSKMDASTSNAKQGVMERSAENQTVDTRKAAEERSQAPNRKKSSNCSDRTAQKAKESPDKLKTSDTGENQDAVTDKVEAKKTEISTTEKTDETSKKESPETDVVETANAEVIKNLAVILDMSEEQVLQILNSLNLSPVQLTDKENLNQFMQAVYQVDSAVELLNIPNINETFESVDNLMDQYDELVETIHVAGSIPKVEDGNAVVQTGDNTSAVAANNKMPTNSSETTLGSDNQGILAEQTDVTEATPVRQETTGDSNSGQHSQSQSQSNNNAFSNNLEMDVQETLFHELNSNGIVSKDVEFSQAMSRSQATRTNAGSIDTQDVVGQIIERMKVDVRGNLTEVKITLTPEHLGDVTLKISTQNGIVTAHFVAENERIKEVIEANFNHLKDTLQQQGIALSSLSVSVGQDSQEQRMHEFMYNQQKSSRRVSQIINGVSVDVGDEVDEMQELKETDVYNNSVNYEA